MRATNPFATRHTEPGAATFLSWSDRLLASVVDELTRHRWRGQIIGPHGCGKTSLLRELLPDFESYREPVVQFELRDGQRTLPQQPTLPQCSTGLIVVDGYEQLRWSSKLVLRWHSRRTGCGLLVTAHQPQSGLPVVAKLESSAEFLSKVVSQLMDGDPLPRPNLEMLTELLKRHDGNMREVLMELYDWYESLKR